MLNGMSGSIKEDICEIGRRMYASGFVAANDGNISVRVSDNQFVVTPTLVSKGFMVPNMLITVDLDGHVVEGSFKALLRAQNASRCIPGQARCGRGCPRSPTCRHRLRGRRKSP